LSKTALGLAKKRSKMGATATSQQGRASSRWSHLSFLAFVHGLMHAKTYVANTELSNEAAQENYFFAIFCLPTAYG
jgi:hypothetical protein